MLYLYNFLCYAWCIPDVLTKLNVPGHSVELRIRKLASFSFGRANLEKISSGQSTMVVLNHRLRTHCVAVLWPGAATRSPGHSTHTQECRHISTQSVLTSHQGHSTRTRYHPPSSISYRPPHQQRTVPWLAHSLVR